jgi:hypothetical protein
LGISFGKAARSRSFYQLAHCTVCHRVTSSSLSKQSTFLKGDTSRDVLVEEGVDAAAVSVTETYMAEEDKVDLRDGVDVAVENSNTRPRGSTDEHTVWSASSSGRLQVVGVERR